MDGQVLRISKLVRGGALAHLAIGAAVLRTPY